jgi:drug/metabolite transporter (DMT)-like permease
VWVIFLGLIWGEKPRKLQMGGLGLAVIGVAMVFGQGQIALGWGAFFALACSVALAAQIVTIRRLQSDSLVGAA